MKQSIRMKIFLPVMILLIVFPLVTWLAFSNSLEAHMNFLARRDLDRLARKTEQILADSAPEGEESEQSGAKPENGSEQAATDILPALPGGEDGESDDALARLRTVMRQDKGESQLLAMNGKFRVLYPKNYDAQQETAQIYSYFLANMQKGGGNFREREIFEQQIGDQKYLLYVDEVGGESQRMKYLVLYCPIRDTEALLHQVSRLVFLIVTVMAGAAILLFWFVAGSISGPVRRLCEATRGIGEKRYQKVETKATVKELCELEDEINRMQEKLQQADLAERTFFQNASHELRTPLMSISGYAQGIQCGVFTDTAQAAGVILEESSRLTEVVDGILALTRMDQLRYQVVPEEIPMGAFLKDCLEKLAGVAYSRKVRLVYTPEKECTVTTDPTLLERAFANVVSNCIRYAKEEVRVSMKEYGDWLKITIEDDGPGIPSEELEHLFERFYKGAGGNHGLGLAIAKCSLEYMGAEIEGYSSCAGALFEITLPQDCRSFAVEAEEET